LKKLRNCVIFSTIKARKIVDLILKEINICINTLKNNKNVYWFSSLFNRVVEMKRKLNDQIFDSRSLNEKFGNKNIDVKSVVLDEDEYEFDDFDIIRMGIQINDFHFAYFPNLKEKYGKADKSNMEIIHNGYTQRCSSFDLNRKLRKGQPLDDNENAIYSAIKNVN
jgi:hypothetical protein